MRKFDIMNKQEFLKLDSGDQVFWNDPDDEKCSRIITITSYKINLFEDDPVVHIIDENGDSIECFVSELE